MAAGKSFAAAFLGLARADLDAGVHEDIGPNDGVRIREYLANFGVGPPAAWCAASLGTWLKEAAAETGIPAPVPGSAGAVETGRQFNLAHLWAPIASAKKYLLPGNVIVWTRGDARECGIESCPVGCHGHIGVIESYAGGNAVNTIEGNSGTSGDRVARRVRPLDDPRLLGVGIVTDSLEVPEPIPALVTPSLPVWAVAAGAVVGWGAVRLLVRR